MSVSDQDVAVLGKRARNGNGNEGVDSPSDPMASLDTTNDDDSDDDVGPMPSTATAGGVKKKRKGWSLIMPCIWLILDVLM
jgi:peptidylprolyl isomerase domain and WD repeat-containing protein 1